MIQGVKTCLDENGRVVLEACIDDIGRAHVVPCDAPACDIFPVTQFPVAGTDVFEHCPGDGEQWVDIGNITMGNVRRGLYVEYAGEWGHFLQHGYHNLVLSSYDHSKHTGTGWFFLDHLPSNGGYQSGCERQPLHYGKGVLKDAGQNKLGYHTQLNPDRGAPGFVNIIGCLDLGQLDGVYAAVVGRLFVFTKSLYGPPAERYEDLPLARMMLGANESRTMAITLNGACDFVQLAAFRWDAAARVWASVGTKLIRAEDGEPGDVSGRYTLKATAGGGGMDTLWTLTLSSYEVCDVIIEDIAIE